MAEQTASWGTPSEDLPFQLYKLESDAIRAQFTDQGAALVSLETKDRDGNWQNITVTAPQPEYYKTNISYLGATVGRYGNRIGQGKFWLDGKEFTLATNNGPNHLHGGIKSFSQVLWKAEPNSDHITFQYTSPNGEEGYPGTVMVTLTVRVSGNELEWDYFARSDAPTVINLTNHTYWNLSGKGPIAKHQLQLAAQNYLEVDENVLPTGTILDVTGTPFDFRQPHSIGEHLEEAGGYDHCFLIDEWDTTVRRAAIVKDPASGRVMEVWTTEPGIQLYTANHFDASEASAGYGQYEAFCLECQELPDAPNQMEFPSTALRPGEEYRQVTRHKFSVTE